MTPRILAAASALALAGLVLSAAPAAGAHESAAATGPTASSTADPGSPGKSAPRLPPWECRVLPLVCFP